MNSYDEQMVRKRMGKVTKSQFVNLRRHLYQHLLTSLRLIQINKGRAVPAWVLGHAPGLPLHTIVQQCFEGKLDGLRDRVVGH